MPESTADRTHRKRASHWSATVSGSIHLSSSWALRNASTHLLLLVLRPGSSRSKPSVQDRPRSRDRVPPLTFSAEPCIVRKIFPEFVEVSTASLCLDFELTLEPPLWTNGTERQALEPLICETVCGAKGTRTCASTYRDISSRPSGVGCSTNQKNPTDILVQLANVTTPHRGSVQIRIFVALPCGFREGENDSVCRNVFGESRSGFSRSGLGLGAR